MEQMLVVELKEELKKRGKDSTGTKPVLMERLQQALQEEQELRQALQEEQDGGQRCPGDEGKLQEEETLPLGASASSIKKDRRGYTSEAGSCRSGRSATSAMALEAARRAGLEAKLKMLKQKHELEEQEREVKQKKEEMEIQMEIAEARATEEALAASIKSSSSSPSVKARPATQDDVMKKLLTASLLPRPDIPIFSGEVTRFHQFLRAFDNRVADIVTDEDSKLCYLEQFTAGTPRDIVRSCLHMKKDGYKTARQMLESRYGEMEKVADTFISKLLDAPIVKADDVVALDHFALELKTCENAVGGLQREGQRSHELDHPKTLLRILEKLPFSVQERWRRHVDRIKEKDGRFVCFSDLVSFVEVEARVASHSAFGRQMFKKTTVGKSKEREVKVRFNRTETREKQCKFCNQDHSLENCPGFAKRPLSSRQEFIVQNRLCFGCFRGGHFSRTCRNRLSCSVCGGKHATVMHVFAPAGTAGESAQPRRREAMSPVPEATVSVASANDKAMKMPILPVKIRLGEGPMIDTYLFMDSGSSSTFCTYELLEKLGANFKERTKLTVTTMHKEPLVMWSNAVEGLTVSDIQENHQIALPAVFALDKIPVGKDEICRPEDVERWPQLRDVVPEEISADIGVLVGVNVPEALEPTDFIPSVEKGPFAVKTRLGWVINGPVREQKMLEMKAKARRIRVELQQDLDDNLASEERGWSVEDHKWVKKMEENCQMKAGHFELPIPLKEEEPALPDNQEVAYRRLWSLKRRLEDQDFSARYLEFMEKMFTNGYAERVPDEEIDRSDGRVNYIPHHGIFGQKSGKLRVVFDCSSSFKGVSMNDSVLQGPDLTTPLIQVLHRFRQEQVAFMGDIDSMFYQVTVPKRDRDLLRFLWWKDGDRSQPVEVWRMTVHPFGLRSSPSCANYALRRTVQDFGSEFPDEACQTIRQNMYVDDCLKSVKTVPEATQLIEEVKELCIRGGFRLAKFTSNRREVLESLCAEERGKQVQDLDLKEALPTEKALGVQWLVDGDRIGFAVPTPPDRPCTRRGMLSVIGAMYDPLGMAAPLILQGRLLLQELTRRQLGWDDPVPDDIRGQWTDFLDGIPLLSSVGIPRCVKPEHLGEVKRCELHHFSDASSVGYGVVSYLRFVSDDGQIYCSFVFGKARLLPVKGMTIPRAELTAATLSARIDLMLRRAFEIDIHDSVFWTDSVTVIRYIRNEHTRFQTFVCNRLAVIRDVSSPTQWRYVMSRENPADQASRGETAGAFLNDRRWFQGPEFLWRDSEAWPPLPGCLGEGLGPDPEVKSSVRTAKVTTQDDPLQKLFSYYSSWYRLIRAVAWILRLKRRLRGIKNQPDAAQQTGRALTVSELREAESAVVAALQKSAFPEEYAALESGTEVRRASSLNSLDPFLKNGIVRVGGRLTHASLPDDQKYPAILPNRSHVVDLLVQQVHEEVGHEGREHVLAEVRKQYWILRGNSAVRRVLRKCLSCRRRQGSFLSQKLADLPADRVTCDEPPFTSTGIDFFGPFFVKRARSQEKRYGVIFTCLASRAVHLEVAASLSTDSFMCALRRFIARRGEVKKIRTDRGTNFIGARRELKEAVEELDKSDSLIQEALLHKKIEWTLNTPSASHHGGVWERLIRSVRKVLDALLLEQTLTDESLHTLFCEVEAVLNSRPLTYVSSDSRDPEPLTPNHLLLQSGKVLVPAGIFRAEDMYAKRRWRQVQYLTEIFWRRWRKEYLPLLQRRQKCLFPRRSLRVDDVVLLAEESLPRCHWPLGRVLEVFEGGDGLVRSVRIRVRGSDLVRPVTKLVLFCENELTEQ